MLEALKAVALQRRGRDQFLIDKAVCKTCSHPCGRSRFGSACLPASATRSSALT